MAEPSFETRHKAVHNFVTLPLTTIMSILVVVGGWWIRDQEKDIDSLRSKLEVLEAKMIQQQFDVASRLSMISTDQAVMSNSMMSIEETVKRLDKKLDDISRK